MNKTFFKLISPYCFWGKYTWNTIYRKNNFTIIKGMSGVKFRRDISKSSMTFRICLEMLAFDVVTASPNLIQNWVKFEALNH